MCEISSSNKMSCHAFELFIVNAQVNILQSTPGRFSFPSFSTCYYKSKHETFLVLEIFPQLFVISPPTVFLQSLAQEAILICFITAAFFHKSNSSALFCSFAAISSRDASLANNFFRACLHVGEDSTPGG